LGRWAQSATSSDHPDCTRFPARQTQHGCQGPGHHSPGCRNASSGQGGCCRGPCARGEAPWLTRPPHGCTHRQTHRVWRSGLKPIACLPPRHRRWRWMLPVCVRPPPPPCAPRWRKVGPDRCARQPRKQNRRCPQKWLGLQRGVEVRVRTVS
jgi:hypothetical protein